MKDVMDDHKREMSKFSLHKNSEINEVDKKFLRCFSAKVWKRRLTLYRTIPTFNEPSPPPQT